MEISENLVEKSEKASIVNRRLDSLAKLLARGSGSTCVGVSVINGQLVVASNDFSSGTKTGEGENKKLDNIRKILAYFEKVTKKEGIDSDERKEIFKLICGSDKSSISEPPYLEKLGDDDFNMIISDVLENKPVSMGDYRKRFKKSRKVAWDAYGQFSDLWIKFNKVEKWLKEGTSSIKINSKETILLKEWKTGVHAEMQILAEITEVDSNKGHYIGVSKLCCLNCSRMLDRADQIFRKSNYGEVKYAGAHKLEFDENWEMPLRFCTEAAFKADWIEDENTKWKDRGTPFNELSESFEEIREKIKEEIDKNKKEEKLRKQQERLMRKSEKQERDVLLENKEEIKKGKEYVYQSGTPSSSIVDSPLSMGVEFYGNTPIHILLKLCERLENELLEESEIDRTLQIMIALIRIGEFSDLFKMSSTEIDEYQKDEDRKWTTFYTILNSSENEKYKISEQELLEIFKNETLVGKEIAGIYRENLDELLSSEHMLMEEDKDKIKKREREEGGTSSPTGSPTKKIQKTREKEDSKQISGMKEEVEERSRQEAQTLRQNQSSSAKGPQQKLYEQKPKKQEIENMEDEIPQPEFEEEFDSSEEEEKGSRSPRPSSGSGSSGEDSD